MYLKISSYPDPTLTTMPPMYLKISCDYPYNGNMIEKCMIDVCCLSANQLSTQAHLEGLSLINVQHLLFL